MTQGTSHDGVVGPKTTVEKHVQRLMGGPEKYRLRDAAELAGMSVNNARRFWRAMGFPFIHDPERVLFTEYDVDVMRAHQDFIDRGLTDEDTQNSLIRAQSHLADRMVLWQYEALVEEAKSRYELDEVSARYWALDHVDAYEEFLIYELKYSWRRHLAAFLRRTETELEDLHVESDSEMTLKRSLGFVDLVAFTDRAGQLSPHQLIDFIQTFEFTCRDVISTHGARVVKMVGDAVLYVADDLETGARVVTEIVNTLKETAGMPEVRASLVWGGVVSRFGDIFGPAVNLASRLCGVAPVAGVLVDKDTAHALAELDAELYLTEPFDIPELQGFGRIDAALFTMTERPAHSDDPLVPGAV